jgi:hypothetical protein
MYFVRVPVFAWLYLALVCLGIGAAARVISHPGVAIGYTIAAAVIFIFGVRWVWRSFTGFFR